MVGRRYTESLEQSELQVILANNSSRGLCELVYTQMRLARLGLSFTLQFDPLVFESEPPMRPTSSRGMALRNRASSVASEGVTSALAQ